MTILALLAGLALSHFLPQLHRIRQHHWLTRTVRALEFSGQPSWWPMISVVLVSVVIGLALVLLARVLAGTVGLLLVGMAAIVYTLGPRDLDEDVAAGLDTADPERRESALEHLRIDPGESGDAAAAATLHAGLARWFGVIFWFALLGVPGALLYRTARNSVHDLDLDSDQDEWLARLVYVLNWPVVALMMAATALMTDLDRVFRLWRSQEQPLHFHAGLLDDLARALCAADADLATGLADGRNLVWRMLGLWLAVLSLLLLAGLLA